ncbi:hypothetical protein LTR70_010448 [Exophiala xenobiotica]|uniref:Zn(2)-C6 fungal-type domain-containing protein n=1 Tax=Lithohypha guttulata TaxID=1690604 RepID=A0ABR0KQX2_9EURO|nr:hypothetical protein LTR24_000490 [Lithohypha guttulata]KAK5309260.1 hypothetical protein LTR70_010448 [Exophiala xenobiotica]
MKDIRPASIEDGPAVASPLDKNEKGRTPRQSGNLKPCERCKTQHLKCNYLPGTSRCQRCERSGRECVRSTRGIRFRGVPVFKLRNDRKNRKITRSSGDAFFKVAETTATLTAAQVGDPEKCVGPDKPYLHYKPPGEDEIGMTDDTEIGSDKDHRPSQASQHVEPHPRQQNEFQREKQKAQTTNAITPNTKHSGDGEVAIPPVVASPPTEKSFISSKQNQIGLEQVFSTDRHQTILSGSPPQPFVGGATPTTFLDEGVKAPYLKAANDTQNYLETILLRYFHEELAPWFDICDPSHHFADILPRNARKAGPLRSALLTISARNLSHNQIFRSHTGVVQWQGHVLPNLTEELAISYHNECIRELLQLSLNQKKLYDETLLAAVVILRTDEEMLHEVEDKQLFLRIASLFIDAQLPPFLALPHTSPRIFYRTAAEDAASPPSAQTNSDLESSGLRQACFWTALRQDLHAALLKQQSVKFPLSRCEAFRQLSPATDAVWANRLVVFCADVLEFCYGSESIDAKVLPAFTDRERWRQLQSYEESLCASLPSSFEPIYCREPDTGQGEVFPSLFYLETTHTSGITYIELARMLLRVFNPTRPKLGHGYLRATKAVAVSIRKTLFRLCGIALSNNNLCPPGLVNASLGIALFGEYFEDPVERNALLGVLSLMIQRYNYYPTAQIANSLRQAWLLDEHEMASSTSISSMDLG